MKQGYRLGITLIVLVLVAGLAAALGITVEMQKNYQRELDNLYKKSYYDVIDSIGDVNDKLDKLEIAEGSATQKELLYDVWKNSELAASNLAQLSAKETDMTTIIRFVNQTGDYCRYLAQKSGTLTSSERETLGKLQKVIEAFRQALESTNEQVMAGESLIGKMQEGIRLIGDSYAVFGSDSSVDYPEMIYDGPFSDGLDSRETRFLNGKSEIDAEQAAAKLKAMFPDAVVTYRTENQGSIGTYLFDITRGGQTGSAQISKKGGYLVQYDMFRDVTDPALDQASCIEKGKAFLESIGYTGMEAVWVSNFNSTMFLNFAFEQDGITMYPDLIKVKVASDNGDIVGLESSMYLYNHVERDTDRKVITVDAARAKVSSKLTVKTSRLCYIPTEWNTEVLCYEFSGTYREGTYYVYIDAERGEEIKVMRVIEGDGLSGTLIV